MSNFLSTLIQREHGGFAAHAISPRLPSRYEPVERNGSVATLEKTEPAGANWDTNGADAHYTPPPAASDQDMRAGRHENTPQPPASMVPLEKEVANTNASSPSNILLVHQPVARHGQVAFSGDLLPADAASERGATESAHAEERHLTVTSRIDDTARYEELSNTAMMSKGEFDRSPQRESIAVPIIETAGPQTTAADYGKDLPSAPTYMEQAHPAKRHRVAAQQISNVVRQNGHDEHSKVLITLPEKLDDSPNRLTVAPEVSAAATATAVPAPQSIVKQKQTSNRKDSPPTVAGPAIDTDTVEPAPTAKHIVVVTSRISSTGNIAGEYGRDSGALPVSREVFPVQVTVGKSGGVTPASLGRLLPDPSSHRDATTPPPAPTINVTIGRIEVRAVVPPALPRPPHAEPKAMSLDQYLNRSGGQRNQQRRP